MTAVNLPQDSPADDRGEAWYSALAGVIVAAAGLLALLGIIAVALFTLPDGANKGQNVVALATSGFGVIGAIVGAYFGVRAANRAVDKAHKQR
jgi:hypothetical protein